MSAACSSVLDSTLSLNMSLALVNSSNYSFILLWSSCRAVISVPSASFDSILLTCFFHALCAAVRFLCRNSSWYPLPLIVWILLRVPVPLSSSSSPVPCGFASLTAGGGWLIVFFFVSWIAPLFCVVDFTVLGEFLLLRLAKGSWRFPEITTSSPGHAVGGWSCIYWTFSNPKIYHFGMSLMLYLICVSDVRKNCTRNNRNTTQ